MGGTAPSDLPSFGGGFGGGGGFDLPWLLNQPPAPNAAPPPPTPPPPAQPLVPAPPPSPGGAVGKPGVGMSPQELDMLVRTVYGEANGQPALGQQAVANVIQNRVNQSGMSPAQVMQANSVNPRTGVRTWQFEPWGSRRAELMALNPNSQTYQNIQSNISPGLAGQRPDPTGGATHFYGPASQAMLGRRPPSWDNGRGMDIGGHRFFNLGYGGAGPHGIPPSGVQPQAPGPMQVASASPMVPQNAPAAPPSRPATSPYDLQRFPQTMPGEAWRNRRSSPPYPVGPGSPYQAAGGHRYRDDSAGMPIAPDSVIANLAAGQPAAAPPPPATPPQGTPMAPSVPNLQMAGKQGEGWKPNWERAARFAGMIGQNSAAHSQNILRAGLLPQDNSPPPMRPPPVPVRQARRIRPFNSFLT